MTDVRITTPPNICGMGHRMKRKEDPRFIQGAGRYVDDIKLPGMLYLDIVRSPYAHAKILKIDASEALALPGVLAVITGEDLKKAGNLHWMPTLMSDTQMVLPIEKVVYYAQEVCCVIATSRYIAADAIELVQVEYEPLPAVVDPFEALKDNVIVRDDKEKKSNHVWHWEAGNKDATDRVFSQADKTVKAKMHIPRIHVSSIETCGMVADWNKINQHLTVYMTSQAPHAHRTVISLVSGIPEHKIRVISPDIGGGFGGKVPVYPGYVCTIVASLVTGKPVKWIEDRSENLQADSFARDYHIEAELASNADGKITGLRVKTLADDGAADAAANPSKFPAGLYSIGTGSYDMEAAHFEVDAVYTTKPPGGVAYRCSFRVTEAVHMIERMTDLLAYERGEDPAEFRMKNFIKPEQFPYNSPTGWQYDSGNYHAALQLALDMVGYDDLRREQAEKRARGELIGIGISSFTEVVGAGPSKDFDILGVKMFDSCEIRVHPTGSAIVRIGVQTQGQGHETTFAQIIAEELGLPADAITVEHGDTDTAPYGARMPAVRPQRRARRRRWQPARFATRLRKSQRIFWRQTRKIWFGTWTNSRSRELTAPSPSRKLPLPPTPTIRKAWKPGWKPSTTTTRPI
jgi:aerobic carbon-monoxide dehydrogenase large subunit